MWNSFHILRQQYNTASKTMNKKLSIIFSRENNIYFNLALENYLLSKFSSGFPNKAHANVPMIYLWRNSPSVIIGRNQNVWSECNLDNIKKDNVNLVRRFTGGGAVYQDLGNTCFTFISSANDYNFEANSKLICSALGKLIGEKCEPSGRNDLCVNGLKFSGAAFKVLPDAALHHGTLLINLNTGSLEKYLTPDKSKLAKHNVKSVKSRVANLAQFKPDITHDEVSNTIIKEAMEYYNAENEEIIILGRDSSFCEEEGFKDCLDKLTNEKWIYGPKMLECKAFKKRFDFGSFEFCLDVNNDTVESAWIYSDTLNSDFVDYLNLQFNKNPFLFNANSFNKILSECEFPNCKEMISEIKEWICQENFV
ncbi:lipoate-protein ligase, putative [Theileria equi strain WA]|uniref:lipoate--protein ligase n=1 Tax=Theileria equi strain WA TaxID=1537102 RepID=L1LG98_THEEQ|nr:lipoate-protein ligase, putative [Theileria equi strain WA]EKX74386.1 lipoate-protein ligase, putative [Theileria equi strain WA]|eukprot:XP_004833838.1 lipoate-protein ligase, putative [Theileria equi strain WA]